MFALGRHSLILGPMQLVTDRANKLDVRIDEWGFVKPEISTVSDGEASADCVEIYGD